MLSMWMSAALDFAASALTFVSTDPAFLQIAQNIATLAVFLASATMFLTRDHSSGNGSWLPPPGSPERATEVWFLRYGVVWMTAFFIYLSTDMFRRWDAIRYLVLVGGIAVPLLLQPFLMPSITLDHGKANVWILIFSFIGNYWYTHYFYSVMRASYTFKSWDINSVPIPMYFATHYYFCFYHAAASMPLRWILTTYRSGVARTGMVLVMSYVTAFLEAFTISGYECYQFADRYMAWVQGSAFYGIYFVVSFPMYLRFTSRRSPAQGSGSGALSPRRSKARKEAEPFTIFEAVVESLATGMAVLCLLDFVRIALGQEFHMALQRPCKVDGTLTCPPFRGQLC